MIPNVIFTGSYTICFGDSNAKNRPIYSTLCNMLGCTPHNYAIAGATWQENVSWNSGHSFINQITAESASNTDAVKLIYIMGGINDYHHAPVDYTAYKAAVDKTLNAIKSKYRNARVIVAFDSGKRLPNRSLLKYQELTARSANEHSCIYISLADLCLDDSLFMDYNHYSDYGAEICAQRIFSAIYGDACTPISGKHTVESFPNAQNANAYGFYGITTDVITYIDPLTLIRTDIGCVDFNAFGSTTALTEIPSNTPLCDMPAILPASYYIGRPNNYEILRASYASTTTLFTKDIPIKQTLIQTGVSEEIRTMLSTRFKTNMDDMSGYYRTTYNFTYVNGAE